MPIEKPQKIGLPREFFPPKFGKTAMEQTWRNPDGSTYDFVFFSAGKGGRVLPSIVFPLTREKEVIALRQFRPVPDDFIIELPGGNPQKPEDTPVQVAERELEEETGFRARDTSVITRSLWFEPCSFNVRYYACLATGCTKVREPQPDSTEQLEVLKVPLREWIRMIEAGEVIDSKSIAVTFLALIELKTFSLSD